MNDKGVMKMDKTLSKCNSRSHMSRVYLSSNNNSPLISAEFLSEISLPYILQIPTVTSPTHED